MMDKQEADWQRQALVEGFVNMSEVDGVDGDRGDAFLLSGRQKGHDYVDMDSDEMMEGGGHGKAELKENTNIFKAAFHVFKANVGTGVFMLPTFYPDAGYVVGVILAILIGIIVVDCTRLLLHVKVTINRRDVTTYSQVCNYVCGKALAWFLFVALCLTQFGFCLMYSQLLGDTMVTMVPFNGSKYVWVSALFIVAFPMTLFSDNLSLLAVASIVATISVFYALICCLVDSCRTLARSGVDPTCTVAGRRIPVGWFNDLANNLMALEGIGIILPVHAACTQKKLVPTMASIVLTGVAVWYLLFGLTGYLAHGTALTTSLVAAVEHSPWGTSIRVFFIINIIFTYPVQFMSAMQLIDQVVGCKPRSWIGIGIRLLINLVVWALAMGMPTSAVNVVVGLIGALPSSCMVMIIPSLLALHVHYAVEHPDEDRNSLRYWKQIFVARPFFTFIRIRAFIYFIVALLIMVIGTYSIFANL